MWKFVLAFALLGACATADPFDDLARAQQRLDSRGIAFEVTRAPGIEAFLLRPRENGNGLETDPMAAALAAAPARCRLGAVTAQGAGVYRADYDC